MAIWLNYIYLHRSEYRRAIPYRSVALSFRKLQIYYFSGKFAKTSLFMFSGVETTPYDLHKFTVVWLGSLRPWGAVRLRLMRLFRATF